MIENIILKILQFYFTLHRNLNSRQTGELFIISIISIYITYCKQFKKSDRL